jgi:cell wall-associated NlpC family hydrolase
MMHWSTRYLGTPYLDHGRTLAGCDCWGLVKLVYEMDLSIELPSYAGGYVSTDERAEISSLISENKQIGPWQLVTEPAPYDVAVFRRGLHESHVGIIAIPGRMLHIPYDHAKIEDYRTGRWGQRLTGFYRHVEAASKVAQ